MYKLLFTKPIYIVIVLSLMACNDGNGEGDTKTPVDTTTTKGRDVQADTLPPNNDKDSIVKEEQPPVVKQPHKDTLPQQKTYSNTRFKDVTVQKIGDGKYIVKGKGQIFEANFGWVVEDGHNEIKKGHQMTDAGAPAWGDFKFTLEVKKQRPNSTLTLILFETSAKDGSRVYELPIALP